MNRPLEEALVEALDLLEQGTPIVKILARYPDLADELRPFLMTARELDQLATPASTDAQEASKREFLHSVASMKVKPQKSAVTWLREAFVFSLALLLILFFSGAVMAVSSGTAVPGDALYGTKRFIEQTRLNYSADSEAAAALIKELHQERLDEVRTLLSRGRSETVTFSGEVEILSPERWLVEGIPVEITSSTILPDEIETGFMVQIKGKTVAGAVLAEQVDVIAERSPEPDPNNPQIQPTPDILPTIEPLVIPERPDLILPDNASQTDPTEPLPQPTVTLEDDSTHVDDSAGAGENDSQDSQESEDSQDTSQDDGRGGSVNSSNHESDDSQDDGQSEDDSKSEDDSQSEDDGQSEDESQSEDNGHNENEREKTPEPEEIDGS
ncbi:MAG: DUF5667 domain-containing protein [Candidatus Promineifilaceae bacterium]